MILDQFIGVGVLLCGVCGDGCEYVLRLCTGNLMPYCATAIWDRSESAAREAFLTILLGRFRSSTKSKFYSTGASHAVSRLPTPLRSLSHELAPG